MNERDYKRIEVLLQRGEEVEPVDRFLFELEQQRRAQPPNELQRQQIERSQNPLTDASYRFAI